ncbi:MAG: DMT family transporter [Candidatus Cyclobacteriaceae bacterium M2_1C_046]
MLSKGVVNMLLATFVFATMNVFVKMVPRIPAVEVVFFRSLISLIISAGLLYAQGVPLLGKNHKYLILRGVAGAVALILYFITLQKMPLASAVTIQFLSPIFTTVLGIFLVGERVLKWQWLFFLMAFIGVLIIQGFDPRIDPLYFILGMISAFASGLAYNFIRKINVTEHPLVIVMYFPLVTLPITGIYCLFFWVQPVGIEWLYLLLIGLLTQVAQYLMTKAYQNEQVSKVASLKYIAIIYALAYGYILFDEAYDWLALAGIILVMFAVAMNVWYKSRNEKKLQKS